VPNFSTKKEAIMFPSPNNKKTQAAHFKVNLTYKDSKLVDNNKEDMTKNEYLDFYNSFKNREQLKPKIYSENNQDFQKREFDYSLESKMSNKGL